MTPECWQRVKEVFHAALEMRPEERGEFIRCECAGEESIASEVQGLLASLKEADEEIGQEPGPGEAGPRRDVATMEVFRRLFSDGSDAVPTHGEGASVTNQEEARAFPVEGWDRYQFVSFVAEGGMGCVYKAIDPKLNRPVALKFLRGDDPRMVERFLQEARAQAQVQHEHICRVYEVGEVQGRHYIAMQYIDGETLSGGKLDLSLEQKVKALKEAAEAVHAAHRIGLIHRDLKPSNIMLEKTAEGTWWTYVMDFGLVREQSARGATLTGIVMGTIDYMSPEQARGERQLLDRRTDVYSLGATLYEVLSGQPPFAGDSMSDVLLKVMHDDPVPLRKVNPRIPEDLETVAMKCLDKEPHRRCESAKALADELQRYLEGEPVLARRTSRAYRVWRKARKHKAVATALSVAILAVLVAGAIGAYAWRTASTRTRMAQRFGQEVERVEGVMQRAYLLPLHDIRAEMKLVRDRMRRVEEQAREMGSAAAGPGHDALGRGHLALQEYEEAREHLERAVRNGYDTPPVRYALGLALGHLYREALDDSKRLTGSALQKEKRRIEEELRKPALASLRASTGVELDAPVFVEGLIAYYEDRYEAAIRCAEQAFARAPWLYEAKTLEGNSWQMIGGMKRDREDHQGAIRDYERAGEAYGVAISIGRSDPRNYVAEAWRWSRTVDDLHDLHQRWEDALEPAIRAADQALIANSEDPRAYEAKSRIYESAAIYRMSVGKDDQSAVDKAIECADRTLQIDPRSIDALVAKGVVLQWKGFRESQRGLDPRPSLKSSNEALSRGFQIQPGDINIHALLGLNCLFMAMYEAERGMDPRGTVRQGIEFLEKHIAAVPTQCEPRTFLGLMYYVEAEHEIGHGIDPTSSIERSIDSYDDALRISPDDPSAWTNLGLAHAQMATALATKGQDPESALTQADRCAQHAIQVSPGLANGYDILGDANMIRARFALDHDADPTKPLAAVRRFAERAIQLDPEHVDSRLNLCRADLLAARWAMHIRADPRTMLARARGHATRATDLNSSRAEAHLLLATADQAEAGWLVAAGRPAEATAVRGLAAVDRALAINPDLAEAYAVRGSLLLLQARTVKDSLLRLQNARDAEAALARALQINPHLQREYQADLDQARRLIAP